MMKTMIHSSCKGTNTEKILFVLVCLLFTGCFQSCNHEDPEEQPEQKEPEPEIPKVVLPKVQNGYVYDIEGNFYQTVQVDSLPWWMAENLKTTKYNDSTVIPNVTDNTKWFNLTSGAYCWYNHDKNTYGNTYGALYNWYAVNTGKLCPAGWHVPSYYEWAQLLPYGGPALKETGYTHWKEVKDAIDPFFGTVIFHTATPGTNTTGFKALPGGGLSAYQFSAIGEYGLWWSSSTYIGNNNMESPVKFSLYYWINSSMLTLSVSAILSKNNGYSIRCVKN
jgi:uncharacterized protein (TIGR02145 family)